MYKSFTAEQYKKHLGFAEDYTIDGVLSYGTLYEDKVIGDLKACLSEMGLEYELKTLTNPFLRFARELNIGDKRFWFMIGYGGAWLSEYLHWACLFGSQKNIFVGSCGGLKVGMSAGDFLVPTSSFGEESSARIYNRDSPLQFPDKKLTKSIKSRMGDGIKIWEGPVVTCQAMIGETSEDVKGWSNNGYFGVEMETSTVFAVSSHFNVPSAAIMYVGDNLIENHSTLSEEFEGQSYIRESNRRKQITVAIEELLR